ncbi:MAG: AraC family transcriptional regulator [Planctomycetaceae bacterium]|jgi:AraC family L-rhamnose operon regulatory protein RhaS|nr:AraC family transcriptional regulator [Planctomycetaceae bacterium]
MKNRKEFASGSPSYRDGSTIYCADSCAALSRAVEDEKISFKAFARGQYPGDLLPVSALNGLRSVGFWNAAKNQDWGLDWHRNEGIEISYLLSGQIVWGTSSSFWNLAAGDMTACRPWQIHRIGNPGVNAGTYLWFIIDSSMRNNNQQCKWPNWIILSKQDLEEMLSLMVYCNQPVFHLPPKHTAHWERLYRLLRDAQGKPPVSALAIVINEILYTLLQSLRESAEQPHDFKEKTPALQSVQHFFEELQAIPEQMAHLWTLREMARVCRISPTRFSQCCNQLTNLSPLHALNRLRIFKAAEMIRENPSIPVVQIAMMCGFSSSQYFAVIFRKWIGKTPSEFRQETLNR